MWYQITYTINFSVMTRTHTPSSHFKSASRDAKLSAARSAGKKAPSRNKTTSKTTYIICGKKVVPTEVFDTFWWFAAERKSIYDQRMKGETAP
jgi:hypothetical protein